VIYDLPGSSMADMARTMKALATVSARDEYEGQQLEGQGQDPQAAPAAGGGIMKRPKTPQDAAWGAVHGAGALAERLKAGKAAEVELRTQESPRAEGSDASQRLEFSFGGATGGLAQETRAVGGDGKVHDHGAGGGSSGHHHHHHHHHGPPKKHLLPSVVEMRRKMVADYAVRQLYLLGSMCLGRNYVSMRLIEKDFPYELLVALVTDTRMPKDFRSGAVYLINCLYVDSNPQTEKMIPELIRSWTSVRVDGPVPLPGALERQLEERATAAQQRARGGGGGGGGGDGSSLEGGGAGGPLVPGSNRAFGDLKVVVVGHLMNLVRLSGDDFTLQLMSLLQRLMKFRFYTTAAQMQAVVQPILRTLDDRRSVVGGSSHSKKGSKGDSGPASRPASSSGPARRSSSVAPEDDDDGKHQGSGGGGGTPPGTAGDGSDEPAPTWLSTLTLPSPKKALRLMESIRVMAVILVVVLVSVALALWTQFTGLEPAWLATFDLYVFTFFAIDITVRYLCWLLSQNFEASALLEFWDFYRSVDGSCVLLDVAAMLAGAALQGLASGSKLLKVLRLARLVRLIRAGNIMLEILSKLRVDDTEIFELPRRYDATPRAELRMMANVVDVLTHVARVAQDYRLSRLLQAFRAYNELRLSGQRAVKYDGFEITGRTTPGEIFEFVIESSDKGPGSLSLGDSGEVAYIMLNLCLYNYPPLVQGALSLLMDSYRSRWNLLNDLHQMQLLTSPEQETMLLGLQHKLAKLQSHAET
jgi:hypothetical protein